MKACTGWRCNSILNFGGRGRYVVKIMPFSPRNESGFRLNRWLSRLHSRYGQFWEEKNQLVYTGIRTPDYPACSVAATVITLSRLPADTTSLRSKRNLVTYAVAMFIPPSAGFSNEVMALPPARFKRYDDKIWFYRMIQHFYYTRYDFYIAVTLVWRQWHCFYTRREGYIAVCMFTLPHL
jgi:hypothetical protein